MDLPLHQQKRVLIEKLFKKNRNSWFFVFSNQRADLAIPVSLCKIKNLKIMHVAVWDTYVTKNDGKIMHFDIIAPGDIKDEKIIHSFGKEYLLSKNQANQPLTARECKFCHIETATDEMVLSIQQKGYYIIEMQNCN